MIPSHPLPLQLAIKNMPKSSAFADLLTSFVDADQEWSGDKPVYAWENSGGSGVCVGPTKVMLFGFPNCMNSLLTCQSE